MMLKWVNNHCSDKTKYIMKSDDDTFVNFAQLIRMLQDYNEKDLLIGALICGARPIANVRSKWYAPKFMYPGRVYPNYLSGSAYLMSTDVVGKLYKAALWTRIFHIEDVFITGRKLTAAESTFQYSRLIFQVSARKTRGSNRSTAKNSATWRRNSTRAYSKTSSRSTESNQRKWTWCTIRCVNKTSSMTVTTKSTRRCSPRASRAKNGGSYGKAVVTNMW